MPTKRTAPSNNSPAAAITAAIVARLEQGVKPWIRPWRAGGSARPLRACGAPYRGINTIWLWLVADSKGYASPSWMTYRQAQALGGQVRKGERATVAVFYKTLASGEDEPAEASGPGPADPPRRCAGRVMRSYAVFNCDQIDGLPDRYRPEAEDHGAEPAGRDAELEAFFSAVPASLRHVGDQAYYDPVADRITMPPVALFRGYDHYYATLAHEMAHWTGHSRRLDRDLGSRFGSHAYAAEELVAELASAMLGAELGLPVAHLDHHASYIDHWLTLLRSDDRAIMTAAARAEEAAGLLLALGGREAANGEAGREEPGPGE